jgi:hypothetical protein
LSNKWATNWREPIIPVATDHDTEAYDIVEGQVRRAIKWILKAEDVERIAQGYSCLNCLEPFETEHKRGNCPVCGYHLADTLYDLARVDRGGTHVGPATTLDEERERLILEGDRRRHTPGGSILVPKGFNT